MAVQLFCCQGKCCILYNNNLDNATAKQVIENHFMLSNVPLLTADILKWILRLRDVCIYRVCPLISQLFIVKCK
jgi:hypothetical protein